MYELHLKVYVKIGEGENATYGLSEYKPALTPEQLSDPAALDALAEGCLKSISNEPQAKGKSVVTVSYEEFHEDERRLREKAMRMFGGMGEGMAALAVALLAGLSGDSHEHDCASCDAEDCPSRTEEFSENLN